jgi:hypothetical protein
MQPELNGHAQPEADDDNDADDSDDDDARVSITNMIVRSTDFRSRIMLSVTDYAFCFMMQAVPFRHLREQQIKSLSLGEKIRKVAKGELPLRAVSRAVPFRHLREQQIKSLSLGEKMRKVVKGELFCALRDKTTKSVVLKYSSTHARNRLSFGSESQSFKSNQGARVRFKSPTRGGKRSQSPKEQAALGSWFFCFV